MFDQRYISVNDVSINGTVIAKDSAKLASLYYQAGYSRAGEQGMEVTLSVSGIKAEFMDQFKDGETMTLKQAYSYAKDGKKDSLVEANSVEFTDAVVVQKNYSSMNHSATIVFFSKNGNMSNQTPEEAEKDAEGTNRVTIEDGKFVA